jgi:hypothetical protein
MRHRWKHTTETIITGNTTNYNEANDTTSPKSTLTVQDTTDDTTLLKSLTATTSINNNKPTNKTTVNRMTKFFSAFKFQ